MPLFPTSKTLILSTISNLEGHVAEAAKKGDMLDYHDWVYVTNRCSDIADMARREVLRIETEGEAKE